MEPVGAQELVKRVHEGSAVALDVRPHEEYVAGHISGKLSTDPLASLHVAAIEPEQQPALFKKAVFSAPPMGCEACPCAILAV